MPILRELQNVIGQGPRQSDLAFMLSMPEAICSTEWPPMTPSDLDYSAMTQITLPVQM